MKIRFHGGAKEVGRSCIEIIGEENRFLMDAGVEVGSEGGIYPSAVEDLVDLDCVFLSHAHLDHTGALPLFYHYGLTCPIYSNYETQEITKVLLTDSLKIARLKHEHPAYHPRDIKRVLKLFKEVQYEKVYDSKGMKFIYYPAGHIPGSSMILVELDRKKILYTGDFNLKDTHLLKGAEIDIDDVDVMICESTYGNRNHPPRDDEEKRFLNKVKETLSRGGRVLIAAFALGRTQEILLMLGKEKWDVPIYIDGMGRQITEILLDYPHNVKNINELRNMVDKAHFVTSNEQRDEVFKRPSIMITTSGMVNGGPVMNYLLQIYYDKKSTLFLTGYQAKDTVGREIEENKSAWVEGHRINLACDVEKFDFSAHSGKEELHELILRVKPKMLILNHGDPESIEELYDWATSNGIDSKIGELDEDIEI